LISETLYIGDDIFLSEVKQLATKCILNGSAGLTSVLRQLSTKLIFEGKQAGLIYTMYL